jgi:type VI secretion system protein ImpM
VNAKVVAKPATTATPSRFGPGFFGKLAARGDFVSRGLSADFRQPWEEWLLALWRTGATRYGERWAPLTGAAPAWRFVLEPGLCGLQAVTGVLVPSADRTGRSFPLSLAASAGQGAAALLPITASGWYGRGEALLRRAAADPLLDFDVFEQRLLDLGPPAPTGVLPVLPPGRPGWSIALDPAQAPALAYPALVQVLAGSLPARFSLWWTEGAGAVGAALVVSSGLPQGEAALALYDGAWEHHGWNDADARPPEAEP